MQSPPVPTSTYRLQFNRQFGFRQARRLIPYLEELGISDVYASPLVQARRGSPHGYDVTDPSRLNSELGTPESFARLARELRRRGMGLLLDIVPNHMAASSENPWWREVLEDGRDSPYASYFDVDWNSRLPPTEDKLVLPVLGESYDDALAQGRLRLGLEGTHLVIRYFESWFPVCLSSYAVVLRAALEKVLRRLSGSHRPVRALRSWIHDCERWAESPDRIPSGQAVRHRRKTVLEARLGGLLNRQPVVRRALRDAIREINGRAGDSRSVEALDHLLGEQRYRLCFWRGGEAEVNYRRFFDVSSLVGLRTEEPRVFVARHRVHRRLVRRGQVTGVRVDHIDGLADPKGYLEQLQRYLVAGRPKGRVRGIYAIVEKILAGDEELPPDWRADGTTGYDFLNRVMQLFVAPSGSRRLTNLYRKLTGVRVSFDDLACAKKRLVMETLFPGELRQLVNLLEEAAGEHPRGRRISSADLRTALVELTACLPIYRTYVRGGNLAKRDREVLRETLRKARGRTRGRARLAVRCLEDILLFTKSVRQTAVLRTARRKFVRRWQQFTGPVMAKGVEDTALYAYSRLLALNEVGGEPDSDGLSAEEFHAWLRRRARKWPLSLNATTTHDTKRSEDARARLCVLSELASEWETRVRRWRRWNRSCKVHVGERQAPDTDVELLIYQTLIGIWPASSVHETDMQPRLRDYIIKAVREAKVHTRWRAVDAAYEQAVLRFIDAILRRGRKNRFLADLKNFVHPVAKHGALNSLAQLLIKIAAPGIPDFYQGSELWDLRLVDPDNRRPVDFAQRRRRLNESKELGRKDRAALLAQLLDHWQDGRVKLFLQWKALRIRRAHRELFLAGDYLPLRLLGPQAHAAFAFARRRGKQWAVVVVPRLAARLPRTGAFPLGSESWGNSRLRLPASAPAAWQNQLTGETVRAEGSKQSASLRMGEVLAQFPVALLTSETG